MRKPWSVSTTVRNPERLRGLLKVLQNLENKTWDKNTQKEYQILLTQAKLYGAGNIQFYKGLSVQQRAMLDNPDFAMSRDQAVEILKNKNYVGGLDMRGRQSFNPLEKFGFAVLKKGKVLITSLGSCFLQEDYDLGELFFKSFLKWQIPNPRTKSQMPPNEQRSDN